MTWRTRASCWASRSLAEERDTVLTRPCSRLLRSEARHRTIVASMRVLVIGWDRKLLSRISWILTEEGYDPVAFESTAEALEAPDAGEPDIIIINTDLPESDKEVRIDALRDRFGDLPVLDVTRRATNPRYETDADAYLSKPFDADSLLEQLEEFAQRGPRDAAS